MKTALAFIRGIIYFCTMNAMVSSESWQKALSELICTRLHRMFNILQGGVLLFQYGYSQVGIFFCYLNGQQFSFQKSESNSFHKGLGTIHIWGHHPLGGRKNCWRIGIKKCWRTGGSGQRIGKKVVTSYMDGPLRIVLLLQNSYDQSFFFTKFWGIINISEWILVRN